MMRVLAVITLSAAALLLSGAGWKNGKTMREQQMASAAETMVSGVSDSSNSWRTLASEKPEYLIGIEVGGI